MKIHWFQIVSSAVLLLFLGILAYTTVAAFGRRSGSTRQDMATIHKQRYDASQAKSQQATP